MALRKNAKQETKTITMKLPIDRDLSLRLEKISKQTGLSNLNLIQKWILQEESLLGLMLYKERKEQPAPNKRTRQKKISGAKEQETTAAPDSKNRDYRKTLAQKAKKLKKEGMTFKKIAETFNEENIATVSGTGKWYTSSITWLLNSMKQTKR